MPGQPTDRNFEPALTLVIACCRPLAGLGRVAAIADAAAAPLDWERLLEVARAHRVEALVQQGLDAAKVAVPPATASVLAERVARARFQMLRNAGEEVRLAGLFADAGVAALFVKGATLGMLAHGTLALKSAWDIDLLVRRADVDRAIAVLESAGYASGDEEIAAAGLERRYARSARESTWISAERGTAVELHWALAGNPRLLPGIGIGSPVQQVAIAGDRLVPTLATPDLVAFVAVHGTAHAWMRLKWLADIAALLHDRHDDLPALIAHAERVNAARCVIVALLLMRDLFGMPLSDRVETLVARDRRADALAAFSRESIATMASFDPSADDRVRHRIGLHALHMTMAPGVRTIAADLWVKLNQPLTPRRLRLPSWLRAADALLVDIPVAILRKLVLKLRRPPG